MYENDGPENPDDETETGSEDWDQCPRADSTTGSSTEVVQGFVMTPLRTE